MVEGQNQNAREAKAQEFEGGEVHLLGTAIGDGDGDTELTNNSEASSTTADADWSITSDNTAGTTTLENTSDINFGQTPDFTLDQVVVESTATTGEFLLDDSPTGDTDLTGDGESTIKSGEISYTLGSE